MDLNTSFYSGHSRNVHSFFGSRATKEPSGHFNTSIVHIRLSEPLSSLSLGQAGNAQPLLASAETKEPSGHVLTPKVHAMGAAGHSSTLNLQPFHMSRPTILSPLGQGLSSLVHALGFGHSGKAQFFLGSRTKVFPLPSHFLTSSVQGTGFGQASKAQPLNPLRPTILPFGHRRSSRVQAAGLGHSSNSQKSSGRRATTTPLPSHCFASSVQPAGCSGSFLPQDIQRHHNDMGAFQKGLFSGVAGAIGGQGLNSQVVRSRETKVPSSHSCISMGQETLSAETSGCACRSR